jgi:hypothetical protein
LSALIDRHEVLRTTYNTNAGEAVQIIHPSAPLNFSFFDLAGSDDAEKRAADLFSEVSSKKIEFSKLPLLRFALAKIREDEHWLLQVNPAIADGSSWKIFMSELANLYAAKVGGVETTDSEKTTLQYADYAVWQRELMRLDGPVFMEMMNWWQNLLSQEIVPTRLPFRRLVRRRGLNRSDGIIHWNLEKQTSARLDALARGTGATHFIVRLAALVALLADVTDSSKVVIGTYFANRGRAATRNMLGLFTNLVPLVFSFERTMTFRELLEVVRNRVFDTEMRSDLPYEMLRERLSSAGLGLPEVRIIFAMSSDHSERSAAGITFKHRFGPAKAMPWGCTIYIDEHTPANCSVAFDAGIYVRSEMNRMLDRYLRLLQAASYEPDASIEKLLSICGANPPGWKYLNKAWRLFDIVKFRLGLA